MVKHTVDTQTSNRSDSRPIAIASRLARQQAVLRLTHQRASRALARQYQREKAQLCAFQETVGVEEVSQFIDAWDAIPMNERQNTINFAKERDDELEAFLECQDEVEILELRALLETHRRRSEYVHWCVERDTRESLGMVL